MRSYGRRHPTPILIISYETLRLHIGKLKSGPIGIMFCDEVSPQISNTFILNSHHRNQVHDAKHQLVLLVSCRMAHCKILERPFFHHATVTPPPQTRQNFNWCLVLLVLEY